jgi:CubicO group peptidase (beta-lactamase class C family)
MPLFAALLFTTSLAAQENQLTRGRSVRGSLAEGDTAVYTVQAGADYLVRGSVEQVSVDVAVRILGPGGGQITRTQVTERGLEQFQVETDTVGVHRIQVIPVEGETGEYVITLDRLERLSTDPEKLADQLLSGYDRKDAPGVAVAAFRQGKTLFAKAYGMANLTYGIPFEANTPTNIGSTSKQFTAFAIMLLVEQGKISLDDDVRKYLPELPDFGDTVRVRNLLTHTTGYREFINLNIMAGLRLEHGDYFDRHRTIEVIQRQPALQNKPGTEFNYNNTSFALLAQIVERISELPFDEFMKENVFEPLGMTRTWVRMSPEHVIPGRSVGYLPAPDGTFREVRDAFGAVGAGGIYSTVLDLGRWMENYSAPKVGSPQIIEQMTTPYVLENGDTTGYGFGLFLDEYRGLERVNHGGTDIGHHSQFYYFPEIDAGLTTQTNWTLRGAITRRLIDAFFGDEMEPEEEAEEEAPAGDFDPAAYDSEGFDEFAGRYALDAAPQIVLTFSRSGDTLFVQATGQPQLQIEPTSDSTFVISTLDAPITFHRDEEGEVHALTLYQNGEQHATRLEDEIEPWEPTPDDLREFEGRYFSQEIETVYNLEMEEGELQLKQRRLDGGPLTPRAKDAFSGAGLQFSFERDRNGQIIGFYVSNGRSRDVRFERIRW